MEQIEATCDDLIEKLGANLPGKLTELNAEITDAYLLDDPVAITLGPRPDMAFPHVSVEPELSDTTSDTGGLMTYNHRVAITVYLQDPDPEALVRTSIRYQRAVREAVLPGRIPSLVEGGEGGYGLQHRSDEYGPPFAPDDIPDGYFIIAATSHFTIQQQQALS